MIWWCKLENYSNYCEISPWTTAKGREPRIKGGNSQALSQMFEIFDRMKKSTTEVMKHLYNEKLLNTNLFDMIYNDVDVNILKIMIRQGWININEQVDIDPHDHDCKCRFWLPKWDEMKISIIFAITPASFAKELGRMKIYELLKENGAVEIFDPSANDVNLDYDLPED